MKHTRIRLALAIVTGCFGLAAAPAQADGLCSAYMMDVSAELQLFREAPDPITAGRNAEEAPRMEPGRLYIARLPAQKDVKFGATSAHNPVDPAKPGGVLRLSIAQAGKYRVSIDANFWLDALVDGTPLQSLDFRSDRECAAPRKIVTFDLPAGGDIVVQLIDATVTQVRVAVTSMPQEPW